MQKYLLLFFSCLFTLITNAQNITSIAGNGTYGYSGDGNPATTAQFEYIWYVALGGSGTVYFTDNANHRIRKVDAAGIISTFAGTGVGGYGGDGNPATAAIIMGASGIAVDGTGNVYFADATNHRLRKINTSGIISTVAGTGTAGAAGDGFPATAAQLNSPYGITIDGTGNIYIADAGNHRIRKINTSGIISTVAGNGTGAFGGDGSPATVANLFSPASVAIDILGNMYISDVANNRIRMVNASGIISTVAGNGTAGYTGDGIAATTAEIDQALSIAVDGIGNILISDQMNHRIRKVDRNGLISTIAGTGTGAFGGDGGPATAADMKRPFGILLDTTGNLYIADWGNYRLRKVTYGNHLPSFSSGVIDSFNLCEDDGPFSINSLLRVSDIDTPQTLTWTVVSGPMHGTAFAPASVAATGGMVTPVGLTYTPASGYSGPDTFRVRVDDGFSIDTIIISVRVKPLPAIGIISGPSVICIGAPVTMTNTVPGGAWHSSSSLATIDAAGVLNGLHYGVDTIYYITTLEGCSSSTSKVITLYPVITTITGPNAVCFALAITLTGDPAGGTWTASNGITTVSGGYVYGVTPGVDTITYSITNPCGTFITQKEVTVNAMIAPVVVISASPGAFILPGQSDTLTANITSGGSIAYDYQWQLNGTDIPGATDNTYISSTFSHHDSVTCIVTNGPCAASSFAWIYIVLINDEVPVIGRLTETVSIIPNPNQGIFKLSGTLPTHSDVAEVQITDIVGRVVYKEEILLENETLNKDISMDNNLPAGIYLLRIMTADMQGTMRLNIYK